MSCLSGIVNRACSNSVIANKYCQVIEGVGAGDAEFLSKRRVAVLLIVTIPYWQFPLQVVRVFQETPFHCSRVIALVATRK